MLLPMIGATLMGLTSLRMFSEALTQGGTFFDYATATAAALSAGLLVFIGRRRQKAQESQ